MELAQTMFLVEAKKMGRGMKVVLVERAGDNTSNEACNIDHRVTVRRFFLTNQSHPATLVIGVTDKV